MAEKIFTKEELERFEKFMEPGRGFLVYHGDADGVCSAAMFLRFFRGFEYTPRKGPAIGNDFVQAVLDKKPELLVFIDLPVDQEWKMLERFLEEIPGLRIVILDHHIAERDVSSKRVLHINPRFRKEGIYIPAACMVYRMLEGMGKKVRPMVWMAAMGTIGDYGLQDCGKLLEECREEYPFLLEGDNPRKSKLGYGAELVAAAATIKGMRGVAECLKVLLDAEGFEDFESVRKLQEWNRELDEELETAIHSFGKEKEVFEKEKLVVFEVKSPLNIASIVSTRMGTELPDRTVVIRKKSGNAWKVSLRNQEGMVNLGDVVKECVKGIGSGGGHEKAAAAVVSDWDIFLKKLRQALSKASA